MAFPSQTKTFKDLNSFCKETWDKTMVREVWQQTPFMTWLWENRETSDWGTDMKWPVMYNRSTSGVRLMSNTAWEPITYEQIETATTATLTPHFYMKTAALKNQNLWMNSGSAQIVDWLENQYLFLQESIRHYCATEVFTGTTGFIGLVSSIANDPTTGTYAAIDRADTTFQYCWRNRIYDASATGIGGLQVDHLTQLKHLCQGGQQGTPPDFCVTTEPVWRKISSIVNALVTIENWKPTGTVDIGFDTIKFNGMRIVWDEFCPAGKLFMLSSRFIKLRTYPKTDMTITPWRELQDYSGQGKTAYIGGQLVNKSPNRSGVMFGLV